MAVRGSAGGRTGAAAATTSTAAWANGAGVAGSAAGMGARAGAYRNGWFLPNGDFTVSLCIGTREDFVS